MNCVEKRSVSFVIEKDLKVAYGSETSVDTSLGRGVRDTDELEDGSVVCRGVESTSHFVVRGSIV